MSGKSECRHGYVIPGLAGPPGSRALGLCGDTDSGNHEGAHGHLELSDVTHRLMMRPIGSVCGAIADREWPLRPRVLCASAQACASFGTSSQLSRGGAQRGHGRMKGAEASILVSWSLFIPPSDSGFRVKFRQSTQFSDLLVLRRTWGKYF